MATPDITVKITADATSVLKAITRAVGALGSAVASTREAFALLPAPPHGPSSVDCAGCYARCQTPETHNWGCGCAPHGPGAARQVADYIAASDRVSCLVADGGHVCLGRPCNSPAPTPGEVLL